MASDYLLELDGVKGETKPNVPAGAIEIESFSWGVSNPGSAVTPRGGGGAGKVVFQDMNFTKRDDATTPTLFLKCATGEHIKKATLFVRKAGGTDGTVSPDRTTYLTIELSDVVISSFQQSGDGSEDSVPTDQFSMNFGQIRVTHTVPEGSTLLRTAGYDLKKNTKV